MPTLTVRSSRKLGFYWEAYGTNPAGETMKISVTVAPEVSDEPTRSQRLKRALRVWKEAKPVSVQVQDVSARGQHDVAAIRGGRHLDAPAGAVSGRARDRGREAVSREGRAPDRRRVGRSR